MHPFTSVSLNMLVLIAAVAGLSVGSAWHIFITAPRRLPKNLDSTLLPVAVIATALVLLLLRNSRGLEVAIVIEVTLFCGAIGVLAATGGSWMVDRLCHRTAA
ncbi:MAG: hypothetical protein GC129_03790 [Proteobacteria bacterium]|nr:hypothetical protein [Pseudomonadota bacterium]